MSRNGRDTFQISEITESYLGDYLKMLETESEQIKKRMQRKKREVKRSIDFIISKAVSEHRKKKIKNYREILEF